MSETLTAQLVRGRFDWRRPTTISSPLIGYFGAGFYSHIDVVTPKGMLRGARSDVIDDIPAGYEDRPPGYEEWAARARFSIEVPLGTWVKFWEFSDAQLHKPYDSHGLIETFVLGREWRDDDSWWCSEVFAACGEYAGLWSIPPEMRSVTPGDCVYLLAGKGAISA